MNTRSNAWSSIISAASIESARISSVRLAKREATQRAASRLSATCSGVWRLQTCWWAASKS